MAEPGKENFIHRILRTKPWVYALLLLVLVLLLLALVFDKIAKTILARTVDQELAFP